MPTVRSQIIVDRCSDCPFFERTVVHAVFEFLSKTPKPQGGFCKYNGLGQGMLIGRLHVQDATNIPETCPLRSGDVLIQLRTR